MYTPYILFGYAVAMALVLIGLVVIHRSAPEVRGVHLLSGFITCDLLGVVIIGSRLWTLSTPSLVIGNLLLILGSLFFYAATAKILGVPPRFMGWLLALSASSAPLLYWTTVHDDLRLRLLIHCSIIGASYVASAVLLFRNRDSHLRSSVRPAAWIVSALSALQLAWLSWPWIYRLPLDNLHPDSVDAAFSYLSMMLGLGSLGALVWLSMCSSRKDLQDIAQTDSLTGLLNRGAFEDILRRDLQRCQRDASSLGVMLIDLDYFKQINDCFGHHVGDDVLRRISRTLREGTRPSDVLARYGGEEFVILLRGAGLDESRNAAERIRVLVAGLTALPGVSLPGITLTASIGVAVNLPGENHDDLLRRADEALYRSKREGRNQVNVNRSRRGNVLTM